MADAPVKAYFHRDPDLLSDVAERAADVTRAHSALRDAAQAAHASGHSWTKIGEVLGITRQATWERFSRPRERSVESDPEAAGPE